MTNNRMKEPYAEEVMPKRMLQPHNISRMLLKSKKNWMKELSEENVSLKMKPESSKQQKLKGKC